MPQFLLYRPKSIIADQLPSKSDRVVYCPLTDTQAKAYRNLTDSEIFRKLRGSQDPCECGSGSKSGSCCNKVTGLEEYIFPCMVATQKLANHLALLIPSAESPREKQEKELEWLKLAVPGEWERLHRSQENILNLANSNFCGKWNVLRRLLEFWFENGDKALVFSRSVRLLKMLHMLFTSTTSYSVSFLDGAMTYEERAEVVNDFNTNPNQFVFLISIGAGGVGLNITSANKVVIVDPHWNPSHDLQAQDRAYRIGQLRDVEVFRLVSAGTIEEVIYARQVYKQQMANIAFNASHERRYFDGVQDRKEQKGEIFGLKNLLAYGEDLKLREIFNRTNIAESKMGIMIAELDTQEQDDEATPDDDASVHVKDEEQADSTMRKIVAQVTSDMTSKRKRAGETKKKPNGEVEWILTQAGIQYTHENSEVIGSSKVESALSRQAMERGNGVGGNRQVVFAAGSSAKAHGPAKASDRSGAVEFKFGPVREVCKRQFCTMARHFGFSDATRFAMAVERWTPEQRRNRLDGFYKVRRRALLHSAEGG
jgi:DNA excision repair protein ERCC-6-like 2